jgi:hypothetical protein
MVGSKKHGLGPMRPPTPAWVLVARQRRVHHPARYRETDCMAGHARLELRDVGAKYPFERSHRFPVIEPNSGHRDYARSKCDGGRRSSDLLPGSGCLRWQSLITEPRHNDDDKTCSLAAHAVRRCSPSSSIVVAPAVSTPIHPTVNSAVMPIIGLGLIDTQL